MSISLEQFNNSMDPSKNGTNQFFENNNNGFNDSVNNTQRLIDKSNEQAKYDFSKQGSAENFQKYMDFQMNNFNTVVDGLTPVVTKVGETAGTIVGATTKSLFGSLGITTPMLVGMVCVGLFIVLKK